MWLLSITLGGLLAVSYYTIKNIESIDFFDIEYILKLIFYFIIGGGFGVIIYLRILFIFEFWKWILVVYGIIFLFYYLIIIFDTSKDTDDNKPKNYKSSGENFKFEEHSNRKGDFFQDTIIYTNNNILNDTQYQTSSNLNPPIDYQKNKIQDVCNKDTTDVENIIKKQKQNSLFKEVKYLKERYAEIETEDIILDIKNEVFFEAKRKIFVRNELLNRFFQIKDKLRDLQTEFPSDDTHIYNLEIMLAKGIKELDESFFYDVEERIVQLINKNSLFKEVKYLKERYAEIETEDIILDIKNEVFFEAKRKIFVRNELLNRFFQIKDKLRDLQTEFPSDDTHIYNLEIMLSKGIKELDESFFYDVEERIVQLINKKDFEKIEKQKIEKQKRKINNKLKCLEEQKEQIKNLKIKRNDIYLAYLEDKIKQLESLLAKNPNDPSVNLFLFKIGKYIQETNQFLDKTFELENRLENLEDKYKKINFKNIKTKISYAVTKEPRKDKLIHAEEFINLIENLLEKLKTISMQANALKLLESALEAEIKKHIEAIGGPIQESIQTWLQYILQDNSELIVSEEGLPSIIRNPASQEIEFKEQSFGTKEQISILYRLAIAGLVAKNSGSGVCLMFDDPFGYADKGRRERILEIIESEVEKYGHQVLLFTCRPEDFLGHGTHYPIIGTIEGGLI